MSAASWHSPAADPRYSGVSRVSPRTRRESRLSPTARPSGVELEVGFLSELVRAHADVHASIDAAFLGISPRNPDLVTLRGELRRRLDQLLDAFLTVSEERDAVDALVPFVFLVDEEVEHALSIGTEPGGNSWPQLQRDLFPERRAEGGDVFYERAGELLREQTPRTTVIAAYVFCLKANFRGRLADEPEQAVNHWLEALAERLPSDAPRRVFRAPSWRAPRRTATYLVVAVAATAIWHLVVSLWAYLQ